MSAYTVRTMGDQLGDEPFRVVVRDETERLVLELCAMSGDHARQVADALALLLPKLRPDRSVVLETPVRANAMYTAA